MSTLLSERPSAVMDADEAQIRRDLAACYRLVALHGWSDGIATHISARLPGEDEVFLINPFGMFFEEITASSLVKINAKGDILAPTPHKVNPAGFVIHSAVHMAREDAGCVIHLHTRDGIAVSTLEEGLLPLCQTAMVVANDIAFHDFEGVALDVDERVRLQQDLGDKHLMLLRNHGTLAVGRTIPEAFHYMSMLEKSCSIQVAALSMGRPLHAADLTAIDKVNAGFGPQSQKLRAPSDLSWPALLRKLDRENPGYAD